MLSKIYALERKVQRAAPKTYPTLATLCFFAGLVLLSGLIPDDGVLPITDWRFMALALCAAFAMFLGRLFPIYFIRTICSSFHSTAPLVLRCSAYVAGLVIIAESFLLLGRYGRVSWTQPLQLPALTGYTMSTSEHWLVLYIAYFALCILGKRVSKKAFEKAETDAITDLEASVDVNSAEKITNTNAGTAAGCEREPSALELGIATMQDDKAQKLSGTDTVADIMVRLSILFIAEVTYLCFLLWLVPLLKQVNQSPTKEQHFYSDVRAIQVCLFLVVVALIVIPPVAIRTYIKWRTDRRELACIATPPSMVETD